MESLQFYIKERLPFVLLYSFCLLLNIFLIIYDIHRFLSGYVDGTMLRFWIRLVIFCPVLIVFFNKMKEFVLVYIDYRKLETETKTVYVKNQSTHFCLDRSNGAYKIYYCSKFNDDKNIEYWMYKKNLIYHSAFIGEQYRITYYKNSKCLLSIEPIFDNQNLKKEKLKAKKSVAIEKKKRLNKRSMVSESVKDNNTKKVVTEKVTTLGIPYSTGFEDHIIAGVPYNIYSADSNNPKIFLKVRNEKGNKIKLILKSPIILGLGDLEERPGYLGYGNFIGTEYEVEYYKVSRVIKSMKLISDQSD